MKTVLACLPSDSSDQSGFSCEEYPFSNMQKATLDEGWLFFIACSEKSYAGKWKKCQTNTMHVVFWWHLKLNIDILCAWALDS